MNSDSYLNKKVVTIILGGGVGSRLYPLTKDRSKPAVPIGGKYRLIDIPISNCLNSGLKRMFVLTQYNSASLNKHIKNTFHFDFFTDGFVDILAAEQTQKSMDWFQGTADAVRQSVRNFSNYDFDYVLILSGDQLYQMDLQAYVKYHIAQNADITIGTIPVVAKDATSFGIMKVNGAGFIEKFTEKPSEEMLPDWTSDVDDKYKRQNKHFLASMGIYIFNRKVLKELLDKYPKAIDFGKELIPNSLKIGKSVASYAYDGYWTDIGDIGSFFEANLSLTDTIPSFNLFDNVKKIYTRPRQLPPSKIVGTKITNSIISEGCIIHAKSIEKSVIGIRSRIGKGSVIKNSYIMGNDFYQSLEDINTRIAPKFVGSNCHIENAIIDKSVHIGDDVIIKGDPSLPDEKTENYSIRKGIVVVNARGVIPSGSRIGKVS